MVATDLTVNLPVRINGRWGEKRRVDEENDRGGGDVRPRALKQLWTSL
jgi:hypothetical protein